MGRAQGPAGPWAGSEEPAHGPGQRSRPMGRAIGASPWAGPKELAHGPGPRSWPMGRAQGAGQCAGP